MRRYDSAQLQIIQPYHSWQGPCLDRTCVYPVEVKNRSLPCYMSFTRPVAYARSVLLASSTSSLHRSSFLVTAGLATKSLHRQTTLPSPTRSLASMAPLERLADQLEAPALDDRSYRVVRLPNKLEALLVHDPDTDKASAAVNVNVGSFSDADDMPGMAHAVEHLLFMGTKKVRGYYQESRRMLTAGRPSIQKRTTTINTSQLIPVTRMPTLPLLRQTTTSR